MVVYVFKYSIQISPKVDAKEGEVQKIFCMDNFYENFLQIYNVIHATQAGK